MACKADSYCVTIFPTVGFPWIVLRIVYWRSFLCRQKCPEALGLHGFITYSTKDIQGMQERMLTWHDDCERCFRKQRPGTLKHRWGRCRIPTVAHKAETKSLKKWWRRSILMEMMTIYWTKKSYTVFYNDYRYLAIAQCPKHPLSSSSLMTPVSITAFIIPLPSFPASSNRDSNDEL